MCSARERIDPDLIEHSDCVGLTPVLHDEACLDPVDIDAVQLNVRSRRLNSLPHTGMHAACRYPGYDQIAFGDLVSNP